MHKYGFVDIFAGAGGLAEGFLENDYYPIAHVEMNKDACKTLETRLAYHYLKANKKLSIYYDYLKKNITREKMLSSIPDDVCESVINEIIDDSTLESIFTKIDENINKSGFAVDVLVGGPPCQAYSLVGRSSKRLCDISKDSKNFLYKMYAKFLNRYSPKIFVFENVLGMLSANDGSYYREFINMARQCNYDIDAKIFNSEDYGVLQNRKRVMIFGIKNDLDIDEIKPEKIDSSKYVVWDLLNDLPPLINNYEADFYKDRPSEYLTKYGIRTNSDVLTWHVKRPNNDRDREIYITAIRMWNESKKRLVYQNLPQRLKTHQNQKVFLDRFKVVAGDLHSSQTMLAHIAKDGHYFIHPDLSQSRSLSVREAARIQSFPDSFFFEGSRCAAFTQIGNAVPPLMAKQVAAAIKIKLEEAMYGSK